MTLFSPFRAGGALIDEHAAVYIRCEADDAALQHVLAMDYLLVVEPRQQGKTSLINALARNPALSTTILAYVDVTTLDNSSTKGWYQSLCGQLLRQLRFLPQAAHLTSPENASQWRDFLSAVAESVAGTGRNLIIALDEIGAAAFPGATPFFSVLRAVYNSRQSEPYFKHLSFLLAGAFHPRNLIADAAISPFNIARRVRLPDFTVDQVQELVAKGGWVEEQARQLAVSIYSWTDGQPYLTQLCCAYMFSGVLENVEAAVEKLRREDENHLASLVQHLKESDEKLRVYFTRILNGEQIRFAPNENQRQAQLELMGLIKADAQGHYCRVRNRIYQEIFTGIASELYNPRSGPEKDNVPELIHQDETSTVTVLFLAADPTDASRLRLGEELREVQEKLRMATHRHRYILEQQTSARPADISQALLDLSPQIVHFSGHGISTGALCFEDQVGKTHLIQPAALAALFEQFTKQVNCVVLNACYSETQANAIAKHIHYVIGMNQAIGDEAAIAFAIGFYQALGAGRTIEEAYQLGCVQIRLQGIPEHLTPVLIKKDE